MTRRELIGMASVGAVAAVLAGGYALTNRSPPADSGQFPFKRSEEEWRAALSSEAFRVLREGGTERPYSSPLLDEHRAGIFACAGCGQALYRSRTKYDSHTGWPSFWDVIPQAIKERADRSFAMVRTEVLCGNCGGHLGHVFKDGPPPTGLRYCMNGAALNFEPATGGA